MLIKVYTRLHSSRMLTARVLTVSPSMLCGGCLLRGCTWSRGGGVSALGVGVCSWGCLLWGEGEYLVKGGVCARGRGVYLVGGVCSWGGVPGPRGVSSLGGVPGPGGCLLPGDVCSGGCLLLWGCTWSGTPPVDRQTPVNLLPCPKLRFRAVIIVRIRDLCIMSSQSVKQYVSFWKN